MTVDMTQLRKGTRSGFGGGPKRTLQELADEFGVSKMTLVRLLANRDGPNPALRQSSAVVRSTTWYDPKAVRKWWSALPEDVRRKASA